MMEPCRRDRHPRILGELRDFPKCSLVRWSSWIRGITADPANSKDGWAIDKQSPRLKVAKIGHAEVYAFAV